MRNKKLSIEEKIKTINRVSDPTLKQLYKQLAKKYDLTEDQVNDINRSQYKFSKNIIMNLDVSNMDINNYDKYKTNFIYRILGKLYIDVYKVIKNNKKNGRTK